MALAIRCTDLRKTYAGRPPVEAVRGVDLAIETGECFGVLGPNGAGKTTAIEMLEGLLAPTAGEIEILGIRWRDDPQAIRRRIGISLQETRFSDKLSVRETVTLFRSFYREGIEPAAVIARVSLQEKSDTWIKNLSGGQKQRLALAVALVGDPALLFLDEPTTGLDPHSRREVWEIIAECRRHGRTTVLTTHYMEEAERLCDRIAIIDQGRVIALGSPPQLIAQLGGEHIVEFSLAGSSPFAPRKNAAFVAQESATFAERKATLGSAPVPSDDDAALSPETWRDLPAVTACHCENGSICLTVTEPHVVLPALLQRLEQRGWQLASLVTRHASLDDVFIALAGHTFEPHGEAQG